YVRAYGQCAQQDVQAFTQADSALRAQARRASEPISALRLVSRVLGNTLKHLRDTTRTAQPCRQAGHQSKRYAFGRNRQKSRLCVLQGLLPQVSALEFARRTIMQSAFTIATQQGLIHALIN